MLANKGYAAYANNKVMTASPAELTLMLDELSLIHISEPTRH